MKIDLLFTKSGRVNPNINDEEWFVKKNLESLLVWIKQSTQNLPSDMSIIDRVLCIKNGIYHIPVCATDTCTNKTKWNKKTKSFAEHCSRACINKDTKVRSKIEDTNVKKYGVKNYATTDEFKQKSKETYMRKYGVSNPAKSKQVKDKIKQTFNKKYGGYPQQNKEVVEKTQHTCLERYGAPSPLESDIVKEKIKKQFNEKYGGDSPFSDAVVRQKSQETIKDRYGQKSHKQKHLEHSILQDLDNKEKLRKLNKSKSISQISIELGVSKSTVSKRFKKHDVPLTLHTTSTFEDEIYQFLLGVTDEEVVRNDRTIIHPKEIDIVIPSKKVAIECNGLYWHCEVSGKKPKHYHLSKTNSAEDKGYHLIHITDKEWEDKKEIVKSRLCSVLGHNEVIYARNTTVEQVTHDEAKQFLIDNHIQGYCPSTVKLGLYSNQKLCAMMTFGRPRYNKKAQWELLRYCSRMYTNVVGGASKLLRAFEKNYSPLSLLSYSDRSWNKGTLYKTLGFSFVENSPPNYYYLNKKTMAVFHRSVFQKHKLPKLLEDPDMNKTEWENMKEHGFDRYWNSGSTVWIKQYT